MRRVRIQFVESKAWKVIWLVTAVTLLSIAGFTGWQVWQQYQIRQGLQVELGRLQAQLKARTASVAPAANPREASEKAIQRLLLRDWNRLYDAIEHPHLAHARLVQLTLDAESGEARLEYELKDMGDGATVTAALNQAGHSAVWRLEGLVVTGPGAGSVHATAAGVRGTWRSKLD